MNNWLASELLSIQVAPFNPADLRQLSANARDVDRKVKHLATIASQLGWSVDASLDVAWEEILAYEKTFHGRSAK